MIIDKIRVEVSPFIAPMQGQDQDQYLKLRIEVQAEGKIAALRQVHLEDHFVSIFDVLMDSAVQQVRANLVKESKK